MFTTQLKLCWKTTKESPKGHEHSFALPDSGMYKTQFFPAPDEERAAALMGRSFVSETASSYFSTAL
jgi:hypothetical protein